MGQPRTAPVVVGEDHSFSKRGYDYLIDHILTGRIQPGDEINRRQVADDLGVSLAPINEAVAQLQSDGFVEVSPRRQTRVRIIRKEDVRGLVILREAIECQAARIYCGEPVIREKKALLELALAVDGTQGGTRENELAEQAFHRALILLVDCAILLQEFDKIMRRRLFHMINIVTPWHSQPPLDSHQKLLKKLQSSSPDEAEAAMRLHLERGREGLVR